MSSAGTSVAPSWSASSGTVSSWTPNLTQGPYWPSFEQFRVAGSTSLEGIRPGMVATLNAKSAMYRILRDEDFQKLLGLASEVHRIKDGIAFVAKAAKIVAKHKDQDSIELLIQSVSMLGDSRVLPERDGHDQLEITAEEIAESDENDFDVNAADIPRPL